MNADEVYQGEIVFVGKRVGWIPEEAREHANDKDRRGCESPAPRQSGERSGDGGENDGQHRQEITVEDSASSDAEEEHICGDHRGGNLPSSRAKNVRALP